MSTHTASLAWSRGTADFTYERYPRDHMVTFGTGTSITASAAVEYRGSPNLVNPEEQLVAALASCHMLTFLAICARKRIVVESYVDAAEGVLEKDAEGRLAVTRVVLRPRVTFGGEAPADLAELHHKAHEGCFIANSVRTVVTVE